MSRLTAHTTDRSALTPAGVETHHDLMDTLHRYAAHWGVCAMLFDAEGEVTGVAGSGCQACRHGVECLSLMRRSVDESNRWGEPYTALCPEGRLIWAVPIHSTMRCCGGVVAISPEPDHTPSESREMMWDLVQRLAEINQVNTALMELRRSEANRESRRAEAIHAAKEHTFAGIRELYLAEEPKLISAVKRGERKVAREIINRVLVGIYFMGRDRESLLKSFLLELVVMLSRSAVEAGADPAHVLGANYSSFADLARTESEEDLCRWLVDILERVMDVIESQRQYPVNALLGAALNYMRANLHTNISRDDAARVACLSPTHFSRALRRTVGRTFTELLTDMRIDSAREMLALTDLSVGDIAFRCGFNDQSYFTKVFQKIAGCTPVQYRRQHPRRKAKP